MSEKVFAIDDETEAYRLIAHFSTYYGDSKQNRKDNIALAARKIDGLVLYPEDEFSFNDIVGRRTVENGFKTAYVIQNGDFVEGVGGGVCQVSSTLYNCALLANLAITCVRAHSLPVSYVAPSFDAMVSAASDLRFVNTLCAPITIRMSANGKYLRAEIYGVGKFEIKRRSMTIGAIPFRSGIPRRRNFGNRQGSRGHLRQRRVKIARVSGLLSERQTRKIRAYTLGQLLAAKTYYFERNENITVDTDAIIAV